MSNVSVVAEKSSSSAVLNHREDLSKDIVVVAVPVGSVQQQRQQEDRFGQDRTGQDIFH